MAVKPHELSTPESGQSFETRAAKQADSENVAMAEILALRKRIEEAKVTTPPNPQPHCSHCAGAYVRGWHAALEAVGPGG